MNPRLKLVLYRALQVVVPAGFFCLLFCSPAILRHAMATDSQTLVTLARFIAPLAFIGFFASIFGLTLRD